MTIISTGKLLVSTKSQLSVYDIQSFECLDDVTGQVATMVWKQEFESADLMPLPLFHVFIPHQTHIRRDW